MPGQAAAAVAAAAVAAYEPRQAGIRTLVIASLRPFTHLPLVKGDIYDLGSVVTAREKRKEVLPQSPSRSEARKVHDR